METQSIDQATPSLVYLLNNYTYQLIFSISTYVCLHLEVLEQVEKV